MKIKKHVAILLTAILLFSTLAFTGCGNETPTTDEDDPAIEESIDEETPEDDGEEAGETEETEDLQETEEDVETEEDNNEDLQEE